MSARGEQRWRLALEGAAEALGGGEDAREAAAEAALRAVAGRLGPSAVRPLAAAALEHARARAIARAAAERRGPTPQPRACPEDVAEAALALRTAGGRSPAAAQVARAWARGESEVGAAAARGVSPAAEHALRKRIAEDLGARRRA